MTAAISGTRRAIRELADGTIRVQIDIDPRFRKEFFELFAQIDMPVAIAPLKRDFEEQTKEAERPKGGELAKLAGMLCLKPEFQEFLRFTYSEEWNKAYAAFRLFGAGDRFHDIAAQSLRKILGIESRSQIDANQDVTERFHIIRNAFLDFQTKKS